MEDQKRLAARDPAHTAAYRRRFDEIETLTSHLDVLTLARRELTRRIEFTLSATVAMILCAGLVIYSIEQHNRERRITRVARALEDLAAGRSDIAIGDARRDLLGRISKMIEATGAVLARNRHRLQTLEHLASWQEAARRLAHELRTPLTIAQLEIQRLARTIVESHPDAEPYVRRAEISILEEFGQLSRFTDDFSAFARIGQPRREDHDLVDLGREFCSTFATYWPNAVLRFECDGTSCPVSLDRELVRQVLVNLCRNSVLAAENHGVTIRLVVRCSATQPVIEVRDDGCGIPANIRARMFEPYNSSRASGEGMGLGLAIAKKIMLEHGGDLELLDTDRGAAFALTFLRAGAGHEQ